jgi:hypothetical protein
LMINVFVRLIVVDYTLPNHEHINGDTLNYINQSNN